MHDESRLRRARFWFRGLLIVALALGLAGCGDQEVEDNDDFAQAYPNNFHLEIHTILRYVYNVVLVEQPPRIFEGTGIVRCDGDRRDVWTIHHGEQRPDVPNGRTVTIEPWIQGVGPDAWVNLRGGPPIRVRLWTCEGDCRLARSWTEVAKAEIDPMIETPQAVGSFTVTPDTIYAVDVQVPIPPRTKCNVPYYFKIDSQ